MKKFTVLTLICFATLVGNTCSCIFSNYQEKYNSYGMNEIFIGEVLRTYEIASTKKTAPHSGDTTVTVFQIRKSYKGDSSETISVYTEQGSCEERYLQGETWLMYTTRIYTSWTEYIHYSDQCFGSVQIPDSAQHFDSNYRMRINEEMLWLEEKRKGK